MFFVNFCALEFNFLDIFVNFTCAFVSIIINPSQYGSAPCWHDLGQFSSPGSQNPVFCPVVRFFKKCIFGTYMLWGVSGYKNFTRQTLSGFWFWFKLVLFRHFSQFIIYLRPKWLEIIFLMVCRYKEFTCIIFNSKGNTIACSGLFWTLDFLSN